MNADAHVGARLSAARASKAGELKRPRNRVRRAMRWVHRTLGLFVAAYVLMASATGAALMFRHEILGLVHPELGPPPANLIEQAERLSAKLEPGSFTSIMFPDEALAAFIVYRPEHRTELFDPTTLRPLEDRFNASRTLDWLFDLHHYMLAGETGKTLSGLFGIAIAVLVFIGLWLWWPWRRVWGMRKLWPRRSTLSSRLTAHTTTSILVAPALLLASLTGAGVIFHQQVRPGLVALLGDSDSAVPVPRQPVSLTKAAQSAFPVAEPRILVPPKEAEGDVTLRVRQASEAHPNGRSSLVYKQATGRPVSASSEPLSGTGNRAYNLLYPLHTGHAGGLPLRIGLFLMALLTFAAAIHGVMAWFARRTWSHRSKSPFRDTSRGGGEREADVSSPAQVSGRAG